MTRTGIDTYRNEIALTTRGNDVKRSFLKQARRIPAWNKHTECRRVRSRLVRLIADNVEHSYHVHTSELSRSAAPGQASAQRRGSGAPALESRHDSAPAGRPADTARPLARAAITTAR